MTKDEALRLALEYGSFPQGSGVIHAIKQALEQPEPAPVVTLEKLEQEIYENTRRFVDRDVMEWMLKRYYTPPPKREWQGLNYFEQVHLKTTHAPLKRIHYDKAEDVDVCAEVVRNWGVFFEAIEAKLREKNT